MPGRVKVRIVAGRNLPVMDRASDTCDAFVEIKLSSTTYKTEVFRHSLNPEWNSEWFRFEVDDEELQDEPLQIRVMDYDTYSANDAIGKVYIDLNPLLCKEAGSVLSGWFPIYDTMHGIRGEINVMVRVHLFSDSNKYRESSCGVQFFYSSGIPWGYKAQAILGFVEELVVNDDPEYQWIDKIRTPRASNEARQTLFSKLSGEVQRKIGLKALELGGNSVLGYHQCFDLEGESGIVVRGIGTAVILTRFAEPDNVSSSPNDALRESPLIEEQTAVTAPVTCSPPEKICHSPAKGAISSAHRRSSDSDLSTTPKAGSIGESGGVMRAVQRPAVAQESLSMLEYPFITMRQFPSGFIQHIGGVVSARSVKLLVQIHNPDEPETRDAWWTELRKEIRSHVRALGCNVVLGYREVTDISDDVCILSASGTAAVLCSSEQNASNVNTTPVLAMNLQPRPSVVMSSAATQDQEKLKEVTKDKPLKIDINLANQAKNQQDWGDDHQKFSGCQMCHIPYCESSVPFPTNLIRCNVCRKGKVPDVLFMTIEPPPHILVNGKSCLLQARVCKGKKDGKGEQNAKEISDSLPFLEYELHRQLMNKLKVKCMNAIFGLQIDVSIGDKLIIAIATGTAAYLSALPAPGIPKIAYGKSANDRKIEAFQKRIAEVVNRNKEHFGIKLPSCENSTENPIGGKVEDTNSSGDEDLPDIDLSAGNKDACILEVDDAEDVDIIAQLIDPKPPQGFELCSTETLPGVDNFVCNLQMFTRIFRAKLTSASGNKVSRCFEQVIKSLFVKLRRVVPCCITNLTFNVDLVDQDDLQITVLGIAIGLGDANLLTTVNAAASKVEKRHSESEMIFPMDEEKAAETAQASCHKRASSLHTSDRLISDRSYCYHMSLEEHNGIDVTPLSYVPGKKVQQYLGNLDFFFIRESNSIREFDTSSQNGGLNGFIQSFISETLAVVRAHVSALGGNAMVGFHLTQIILAHNPHKNQGQCLVNVAGDAVSVQAVTKLQGSDVDVSTKVAHFEVQDSYGP